jgi:predicted ATPase/DNA-binding CsgD family transcriptional regulator/predicted negative regulator of RcsB-dependent stress response
MDDSQAWRDVLSDVSLTEREFEVLQLKARRRTNAEIAETLFISITTVKWHVRQIYNKLGVNNRAEAVALARQLGLLDQRTKHPEPPHRNLPQPATPFIGREQELESLSRMLTDPGIRLITLTGPGGIGKTRLALQAATLLQDRFADKPCWVSYSAQDDTAFVFSTVEEYIIATISTAIGLSLQGSSDPKYQLISYLQSREMLLILDSFEHLLPGINLIPELWGQTTGCKFLVTSRERLNIPGEMLYPVQGMAYAQDSANETDTTDSVRLFLQVARRVSDKTYLDPPALAVINRICARLEGIPLAIELAADWTRMLPLVEIEGELDRGLGFLDTGPSQIRSVFDRSWNLLAEGQRASLARLAVFQRGFTREAAFQVADADLGTLSALFDKSLIQRTGENRYSLHDLLRQYVSEQLGIHGEREMIRDRHCAFYAALVADQQEAIFRGDHSKILPDLDNIRAAWQWAVRRCRLEDLHKMLWPLDWFYNLQAHYKESMAAMQLVIDAFGVPEPEGLQGIVYGKALASYGLEKARVVGAEEAAPAMQKGLEILRSLEAKEDLAWPQLLSGFAVPDPQEREKNYLESLAIFEELDDLYGMAASLGLVMGSHYTSQGRYVEALQSIERGLAISRSLDDPEGTAAGLRSLGHLNLHLGKYESARENFQEESELWRGLSFSRLVGEAIRSVGQTYLAEEKFEEAEKAFQESLIEFELVGDKGEALFSMLSLAQIACERKQYQKALELLQDAHQILERRSDIWEQARWWQLNGRVCVGQGDAEAAQHAFEQALEYSLQIGGEIFTETILDFVEIYPSQFDQEIVGRLLGYAQSQTGLSTAVVQNRIEPLRRSLALRIDEDRLALLLKEGAALDQKVVLNLFAEI